MLRRIRPRPYRRNKNHRARLWLFLVGLLSVGGLTRCSCSDSGVYSPRGSYYPPGTTANTNSSGYEPSSLANGTSIASSPTQKASASRVDVEEADLYKRRGHLLFYMHLHKGFMVFDQSDPKKPKKLASLPVYGRPVEMFVAEKTAFLLLRDAWTLLPSSSKGYSIRRATSRLISIDISDVKHPKVNHFIDYPSEFKPGGARKRGSFLYILANEPTSSWTGWGGGQVQTKSQSALYTVNVTNPSKMVQVDTTVPTKGRFATRTTNIVGEFVKDGPKEEERQRKEARNAGRTSNPSNDDIEILPKPPTLSSVEPNTLLSTVVTATSDRLLVVENWLTDAYVNVHARVPRFRSSFNRWDDGWRWERGQGCNEGSWVQQSQRQETEVERIERSYDFKVNLNFAVVNVYDISQSDGKPVRLHRFLIHGAMSDQFKQTHLHHKGTPTYLGIVRRNRVKLSDTLLWTEVQNSIVTVKLDPNQSAVETRAVPFGKPGETVRGSFFDHKRKIAYAITATGHDTHNAGSQGGTHGIRIRDGIQIPPPPFEGNRLVDPLYAISFSDPDDTRVLSEIDGLSGDIHLFRPIENGQYLLAVGRDTSSQCSGFDASTMSYSRASVSLFDVRNPKKLRLVQRKCVVTHPDIKVVTSKVNWDRDQAHKQIALLEQGNTRLLALPVNFTLNTTKPQLYTAVGFMTWNVNDDKPGLPAKSQNVLKNIGSVTLPEGDLDRILWMESKEQPGNFFLTALAAPYLINVGIKDDTQPQNLARLPLQSYVEQVFRMGSFLVEQVAHHPFSHRLARPLKQIPETKTWNVRCIGGNGVEHSEKVTTLSLKDVVRVLRWGKFLVVFRQVEQQTLLQVLDFTKPENPIVSKSLVTKPSMLPTLDWINGTSQPKQGTWLSTPYGLILVHRSAPISGTYVSSHSLIFLDLRKASQPVWKVLGNYELSASALHAPGNNVFFFSTPTSSSNDTNHKHKVWRWEWQDEGWRVSSPILLPGPLVVALWNPKNQRQRFVVGVLDNTRVSQLMLLEESGDRTQTSYVWLDMLTIKDVGLDRVQADNESIVLVYPDAVNVVSVKQDTLQIVQAHHVNIPNLTLMDIQNQHWFFHTKEKQLVIARMGASRNASLDVLFGAFNFIWQVESSKWVRRELPVTSVDSDGKRFFVAGGPMGTLEFPLRP